MRIVPMKANQFHLKFTELRSLWFALVQLQTYVNSLRDEQKRLSTSIDRSLWQGRGFS